MKIWSSNLSNQVMKDVALRVVMTLRAVSMRVSMSVCVAEQPDLKLRRALIASVALCSSTGLASSKSCRSRGPDAMLVPVKWFAMDKKDDKKARMKATAVNYVVSNGTMKAIFVGSANEHSGESVMHCPHTAGAP